jgi:hypothetical protein
MDADDADEELTSMAASMFEAVKQWPVGYQPSHSGKAAKRDSTDVSKIMEAQHAYHRERQAIGYVAPGAKRRKTNTGQPLASAAVRPQIDADE